MNSPVCLYQPDGVTVDERQVLRYMGCGFGKIGPEILNRASQAAQEAQEWVRPGCCFLRLPVRVEEDCIDFQFMQVKSRNLYQNLQGCQEVFWIGATAGLELDRRIRRWERVSPVRALALDAAGAAAVEDLCGRLQNKLENCMAEEGFFLRPRFSAGYGDFPLEAQKEIVKALDMGRKIGVTLTDSLMLSPSKSVTAVIGISSRPVSCSRKNEPCGSCEATDCPYRA